MLIIILLIIFIICFKLMNMHLNIDFKSFFKKGFNKIDNAFGLILYNGKQGKRKNLFCYSFL